MSCSRTNPKKWLPRPFTKACLEVVLASKRYLQTGSYWSGEWICGIFRNYWDTVVVKQQRSMLISLEKRGESFVALFIFWILMRVNWAVKKPLAYLRILEL